MLHSSALLAHPIATQHHLLKRGIDIVLPKQSDIQCYKLHDFHSDISSSSYSIGDKSVRLKGEGLILARRK